MQIIRTTLQIITFSSVVLIPIFAAEDTVQEMQVKLQKAMHEIELLKSKLAQSQRAVENANSTQKLVAPSPDLLAVDHPILSAGELAALASDASINLKNAVNNKVVSVTGSVERFSEGIGRGFKVFLETPNSSKQVVCNFFPTPDIRSTHSAHDGSEMILEHERRGAILLASVRENVIISGYFESTNRSRVVLTDCVLQKQ